MDVLVHRCAGLDVHRDTVVATVRVPGSGRLLRAQHTRRHIVEDRPCRPCSVGRLPQVMARRHPGDGQRSGVPRSAEAGQPCGVQHPATPAGLPVQHERAEVAQCAETDIERRLATGVEHRLGRSATPEQMQQILDEVKARSLQTKGLLDDEAFSAIVDQVTS
jgi:hypothetical protein